MTDEKKRTAKDSRTGRVPRLEDLANLKFEPPQPESLPEVPEGDTTSITGMIIMSPVEGVDTAKNADDHVSRHPGKSVQPKKQ
jgi:hypothetical protein